MKHVGKEINGLTGSLFSTHFVHIVHKTNNYGSPKKWIAGMSVFNFPLSGKFCLQKQVETGLMFSGCQEFFLSPEVVSSGS